MANLEARAFARHLRRFVAAYLALPVLIFLLEFVRSVLVSEVRRGRSGATAQRNTIAALKESANANIALPMIIASLRSAQATLRRKPE